MEELITLRECLEAHEREITVPYEKDCETCDGTGAAPGTKPVTCRRCGGRGQIVVDHGIMRMAHTCPSCNGTGTVIKTPCPSCDGSGRELDERKIKVQVPAGVDHGMRIRVRGKGEQAPRGGDPGDLYIVFRLEDHPTLQREGDTLTTDLPIDIVTACLGGELTIEGIEGDVDVKVKPGTQPGDVIRVRREGMPQLNSSSRGDLLVRVIVEVPKKLSKTQRKHLEAFRDA